MGLDKLFRYAKDCGLYQVVNMGEIANDFRTSNAGEPVIAVDGWQCAWYLHTNMDCLHGGQYREFRDRCVDFVEKFRGVGLKLSFFFEGLPVEEKLPSWLKRRASKAQETTKLFNKLRVARSKGAEHFRDTSWLLPEAMTPCATVVFKHIGCETRLSTADCNTELAQFAANNKCCIGVLSNVPDLLVYSGVPCLFPFSHLEVGEQVVGWRFQPAEIASHLGIEVDDLPVYASFLGNDFWGKEELQESQRMLRNTYGTMQVPQLVAELLKKSQGDLKRMCEVAFGDKWREGLEFVQKSVRSYKYEVVVPVTAPNVSRWDTILQHAEAKHVSCEIPGCVFTVMKYRLLRCGDALEDLSVTRPDSPPTGTVVRGMLARMYTVLLWDSGTGPFQVTEYIPTGLGEVSQETVEVQKTLPEGVDHPGLLELWSGAEGPRWRIFAWAVSPTINLSALQALSPQYLVVPAAALFYLYREAQILTLDEVKSFVTVAVCIKMFSPRKMSRLHIDIPDERAIYLATLFVRTALHVLDVAGACGLSFPRPADCHLDAYFDGKLFHYIYIKSQHTWNPKAFTAWDESHEETFNRLLNVIE